MLKDSFGFRSNMTSKYNMWAFLVKWYTSVRQIKVAEFLPLFVL